MVHGMIRKPLFSALGTSSEKFAETQFLTPIIFPVSSKPAEKIYRKSFLTVINFQFLFQWPIVGPSMKEFDTRIFSRPAMMALVMTPDHK